MNLKNKPSQITAFSMYYISIFFEIIASTMLFLLIFYIFHISMSDMITFNNSFENLAKISLLFLIFGLLKLLSGGIGLFIADKSDDEQFKEIYSENYIQN